MVDAVGTRLDGDGDLADALATQSCAYSIEALRRLDGIGQEEVVILEVEDANAVAMVQLAHLGDDAGNAAIAKLLTSATLVPRIDAAKRTLTPASPAGQNAGDGLVEVAMEDGAFRPGQIVQMIRIFGARIGQGPAVSATIAEAGNPIERIKVGGEIAHDLLTLAEGDGVKGGKLSHQPFTVEGRERTSGDDVTFVPSFAEPFRKPAEFAPP